MRARIIIFGLLTMSHGAPALSENWREVAKKDGVAGYIDRDAIKRDGEKVRYWLELRFPEAQTAPTGERFDRMAAMVEINCRTKSYLSLRNRVNLGDRMIYTGKTPFAEVRTVRPGTPADAELRAVCFNDWPTGP